MKPFGYRTRLCLFVATALTCLTQVALARAPRLETIWNFGAPTDALHPSGALTVGPDRALYGVANSGGQYNGGAVYRLAPPTPGHPAWQEEVIWSFPLGMAPAGKLLLGLGGRLYGASAGAGWHHFGFIFELTPPSAGQTQWSEAIIWKFRDFSGGSSPVGLVAGPDGALYGTTAFGGQYGYGTVFTLMPPRAGQLHWSKSTLWNFSGGTDGGDPFVVPTVGPNETLFGTTTGGGTSGQGTAYKLSPAMSGRNARTLETLWSFSGSIDGSFPSGLLLTSTGTLYGATSFAGAFDQGSVFRLDPPSPGQTGWTETIIWSFNDVSGSDGENPGGGVVGAPRFSLATADDNDASSHPTGEGERPATLLGTTYYGGTGGVGTVYALTRHGDDSRSVWTESILANFPADGLMGSDPSWDLSRQTRGLSRGRTWYVGTTINGGTYQGGTAFRIEP